MNYDVTDLTLADAGLLRIEWAEQQMPVLRQIRERFAAEKPLAGHRIAACLHVTTETANLIRTLTAGGAHVRLCASNPLSTQDDCAAAMVQHLGEEVYAIHGEDRDSYYKHINAVLDFAPTITIDDGADLINTLHTDRQDLIAGIRAGMEETTTGVIRLRAMAAAGALRYPVIAVNDAMTKHLFDNRYGTGQSTIDGILRATNILIAGRVFVVAGYGMCGRGVASRARGMGAKVLVCEVDALRALEATMDGFDVMPMGQAASLGDIFVTVTGDTSILRPEHFAVMKDGAVLANSGHFDVEVDVRGLAAMTTAIRRIRAACDEYLLTDGRRLYLLGEGRLVNLAAAEGHPAAVMDMSFANQALCSEWVATMKEPLSLGVHNVPTALDEDVARLKLAAMGVAIDTLTPEQSKYLSAWEQGT